MSTRFTPELEFALGADLTGNPSYFSWYDYTNRVHLASKVTRKWGRQNRQSQIGPASLTFTLLNEGDDLWVPDNPMSELYGLIDINTPVRLLMRPNENAFVDVFARSAASSWGSADSGGSWTNTGGAASDYSVSSTNGGRHQHGVVNTQHCSTLAASLHRIDIVARVRVNALSTGGPQRAGILARYVDANNHARGELQFATSGAIVGRLTTRSGGTDTVLWSATSTLTHSTSTWYWMRLQTGGTTARMKVWADGTDEPRGWLIDGQAGTFGATITDGAVGLYSLRETGNTNANAQFDFDDFAMLDGPYIMQTCYMPGWPTEWTDASGNQSIARVTAYGRLQSLQNSPAFRSALYRANTIPSYADDPAAVAYWPLEDGSGATQFASGLTGGRPAYFTDCNPAADSSIAGSEPLPTVGAAGTITGTVPAYATSTEWAWRFAASVPAAPSVATGLFAFTTNGTIPVWELVLHPAGTFELRGYNSAGVNQLSGTTADYADGYGTSLYGRQVYVTIDGEQSGGNIAWTCYVTGVDADGAPEFVTGTVAGTVGALTGWAHSAAPGLTAGGHVIGHVAAAASVSYNIRGAGQAGGYAGEMADDRWNRLLAEEGIAGYWGEILGAGVGTTTQQMGPQGTGSLYAHLREIERTEQGLLMDGQQGHPTILPRSQRANHAVNLTLDVAQGHIAWPLQRAVDDALLVNEVTASRSGGSSAVARDDTLWARVGPKRETWAVNPADDTELPDIASWRLHLGTNREARYPAILLDFARNPDLIRDYLESYVGARAQVTNPPGELPPDDLDLLVEGGIDVIDPFSWRASVYASPASSWNVFELAADDNLGRLDTSGSTLGAAGTSSATTLQVVTTGKDAALWSTTGTPYDIGIAGERITVTAMATAVSDAFGRTTSNGWGSEPTSGVAYVTSGGSAGDYAVGGGVGTHSIASVNVLRSSALDISSADVDFRVDVSVPLNSPGGAAVTQWICGRYTDSSNYYVARLDISTAGAVTLTVYKRVAGVLTSLVSAGTLGTGHVSGDSWRVRLQVLGTVVRARAWMGGSAAEPAWWAETTDSDLTTGSSIALLSRAESGNTDGTFSVSWDNLVVLNPQAATVTRSVNGVVKAQVAGADIRLWRPGVRAL